MNGHVKRILFRFLVVICAVTLGFGTIGFSLYSWAWFKYVGNAQRQIDALWAAAGPDYHLTLTGDKPHIAGYPMRPHLTYAGKLMHESGFAMDIPTLTATGYPTPGQLILLDAPQGLTVEAPMFGRTLALTNMKVEIVTPSSFPASADKADVLVWQQRHQPMIIHSLDLTTASKVHVTGDGLMGLDDTLQLAGYLNARVVGLDALLDEVSHSDGNDKPQDGNIAAQFLKMLSKTDPQTGETYFETTIKVQSGGFYFGPIRFATVPTLSWGDSIATPRVKPQE